MIEWLHETGLPPVFVPVGELVKTVESVKAFFLWLDHIITLDAEAVKGAAYLTYNEREGRLVPQIRMSAKRV